ncbi:MAG TPA: acetolactate synthase large subunit [Rhizomicrobium sp.]|nr:acetolactate synthase large subunit [Rhizomicrobium sp.]
MTDVTVKTINGAESVVQALVAGGVEVSFANPGTSEMHFVAAVDRIDGMRCVLCLHETVTTGAADGYYRMAGKPASTLLHLGPGLANALANLHNLKRARSGVVNIVGEHATYHLRHDALLTSDIQAIAKTMSHWVRTSSLESNAALDCAEAIFAASQPPGQIATLILPADVAWSIAALPVMPKPAAIPAQVCDASIEAAAAALTGGGRILMMLGGRALREESLYEAGKIAAKTGARLSAEVANARLQRGAGRVAIERMPYPVPLALETTQGVTHVILVGAKAPVAVFAYPGKPSLLYPHDAKIITLAAPGDDIQDALERLVDKVGASKSTPVLNNRQCMELPKGALTPLGIGAILCNLLPENAIVTDESITTGRGFFRDTHGAAPHDWLSLTGGAIGEGLPLAVGAAIACPDRKIVALQADGAGMYSLQAIWTIARERLDVTICIWANRAYAILKGEMAGVGGDGTGRKAQNMLSLADPPLDWVKLAAGMGVEGARVTSAEAFADVFGAAVRRKGPFLIEIDLSPSA